jgi:hypothetical protein
MSVRCTKSFSRRLWSRRPVDNVVAFLTETIPRKAVNLPHCHFAKLRVNIPPLGVPGTIAASQRSYCMSQTNIRNKLRITRADRINSMRASTKILTGFIIAAALGFGTIVAQADSPNGPDAGIGIPGYNVPYSHSASGLGPGQSYNQRHHYRYSYQKFGHKVYTRY